MRHFISNELEPLTYLVYMLALYLEYRRTRFAKYGILCLFYAVAAALLFGGLTVKAVLNNWSYNALFLLNICVFTWYFCRLLQSRVQKAVMIACCFVNIVLLFYAYLTNDFFATFNGYMYGVSFITIVLFTLFYFHRLLTDVKGENLLLNFDFWLSCGYLFYFLGTFFIVIYYEHVDVYRRADIWTIQNFILLFCALTAFTARLLIVKRQRLVYG